MWAERSVPGAMVVPAAPAVPSEPRSPGSAVESAPFRISWGYGAPNRPRAVRLLSSGDAHGVEVAVVVEAPPAVAVLDAAGGAVVPVGALVPVLVAAGGVVVGGGAGAGVTLGVGNGTANET